jgi:Zn-dependent protease with chaperone function
MRFQLKPATFMVVLALCWGAGAAAAELDPEGVPVEVPPATTLALQYYHGNNAFWLLGRAWSLALPAALLWTGVSARMRTLAARVGRRWLIPTAATYAILYLATTSVIELPLDYHLGFTRQHAYGLSTQSWQRWAEQWAKGLATAMLLTSLLLWIPYAIIRRSPKRWWLWCGLLTLPLLFASALLKPIWLDPLFHHYGPMRDQSLERKILALANRAGIDGGRVFEVDMSRDTKAVNAYVTGMGGTKRIVLWDTLLKDLTEDEILTVMGHEMGHYVLGHVARGLLVASALSLAGFWFVDRAGRWLITRAGRSLGFGELGDIASVPLVVLLANVYLLVALPVGHVFGRYQEHEADRFALELTRANHSAAVAFVKLQYANLSNPRPDWYYTVLRGSHPILGDRIEFANSYHPWRTGAALRYGEYFRPHLPATRSWDDYRRAVPSGPGAEILHNNRQSLKSPGDSPNRE